MDALNQPIELGKKYGYSKNSNGIPEIVIGVAKKENNLRVTLDSVEVRSGLYGSITSDFTKKTGVVIVFACLLFKIV